MTVIRITANSKSYLRNSRAELHFYVGCELEPIVPKYRGQTLSSSFSRLTKSISYQRIWRNFYEAVAIARAREDIRTLADFDAFANAKFY